MIKIKRLLKTYWIFLLIFFLALILYTYRLNDIPFAVHGDEGETADFARSLIHKSINFFSVGWYDLPTASFLPHSLMMKIFGENVSANRLGSVIFGLLTLPFFYGLVSILFTKRIALFATFFLTVSQLWLAMTRIGITYVQAAFLVIAAFYFFIKGMKSNKKLMFFMSGLFIGACFYSYYAARIAPVILGIYTMLSFFNQKNKLLFLKQLFIVFAGFLIIFLPQGIFYLNNPQTFMSRTQDVFVFSEGSRLWMSSEYAGKDNTAILFSQLKKAFNVSAGDGSWQYGYKGLLIDPLIILLILSGIIFIFLNWTSAGLFVLIWFICVLFIGQVLTSIPSPIFLPRFIVGIPVLALFAALGLELYLKLLFKNKLVSQILIFAVCAAVFIFNIKTYFIDYPAQLSVSIAGDANGERATKIGYQIASLPREYSAILVTEPILTSGFGTIRFLAPEKNIKSFGDTEPNSFYAALPNLNTSKTVFYFYPEKKAALEELKKKNPIGREEVIKNPAEQIQYYIYIIK